jgi:hypothetical protein
VIIVIAASRCGSFTHQLAMWTPETSV